MSAQSNSPWQDVLVEIRKTLRKQQYDTWFKRIRFTSSGGEEVQLIVPNRFYADWLEAHYRGTVVEAVRRVMGFDPQLRFAVDERADESAERASAAELSPPAAEGLHLNRAYSLESLVVGNCNRLAQAAARTVAECPGTVYNPLFVHARPGLGKTHVLQGVCHRFAALHPGEAAAYVPAEKFVAGLVQAEEAKGLEAFRSKYRSLSLLALDDVQFLADRENSQQEFFHIFNELHSQKRQVVVSSDRPPQEIPGLSDRLISRLTWGLVVGLAPPEVETRLAILRDKARERHLDIPDAVIEYLGGKLKGSVRELEAALIRLAAFASLGQKPVSLSVAREALQSEKPRPTPAVSVPRIQEAAAAHFGLTVEELVSKRRSRSVAFPRQVSMYLARRLTNMSFGDIGKLFGGRDHTTVLYACDKIENQKERDSALSKTLRHLTDVLKA